MKNSAILDIFAGRINQDLIGMKLPKKDRPDSQKLHIELKENLSPDLMKLHEEIVENNIQALCDEIDFFFAEGFKLGLRIGMECSE
jgi:hypothetical protein